MNLDLQTLFIVVHAACATEPAVQLAQLDDTSVREAHFDPAGSRAVQGLPDQDAAAGEVAVCLREGKAARAPQLGGQLFRL